MKRKKRKLKIKNFIIVMIMVAVLIFSFSFYRLMVRKNEKDTRFLGNDSLVVSLYNEKLESIKNIVRGEKVVIYPNQKLEDNYIKISYNEEEYYVNKDNLVERIEDVVFEKEVYVRTSYNINKDLDSIELLDLMIKGSKLDVIGYDTLLDDGNVLMYKVRNEAGTEGYFYQKYTVASKEDSLKDYDHNGAMAVHKKQVDKYGGGDAVSLDYYPVDKPKFKDNVMPNNVYSLYLNGTKQVIKNVDSYIDFAKQTKINAFVVDIIDDSVVSYQSPYMKEHSPSSYKVSQNTFESYKEAIKKLKDNGFYVIGRITAFKNSNYVSDYKDNAISDKSGKPLRHQSSYWPTAFNRDVWEYDVAIAKEAVKEIGFNEIQFDYVRFPDGLGTREKAGTVNYKNTYKETKAQAIQRFIMYAVNELHKLNAYVSCDVFGESSYGSGYVTSYGQYWPAISTVTDVISAMPYTDHFGPSYGGHQQPWLYPYDTVNAWAKTASNAQKLSASPAIARTWITAYNTPVAASGTALAYNGEQLEAQIKALYANGLNGGYMTWNAYAYENNLKKYKLQQSAFKKEYQ